MIVLILVAGCGKADIGLPVAYANTDRRGRAGSARELDGQVDGLARLRRFDFPAEKIPHVASPIVVNDPFARGRFLHLVKCRLRTVLGDIVLRLRPHFPISSPRIDCCHKQDNDNG